MRWEERFWKKVNRSSTCWLWLGARGGGRPDAPYNTYGIFRYRGKNTQAHRLSWIIANGGIPDGLMVLHRCDTPLCVRPDHLFLGTQSENMKDAAAKKRLWQSRTTHCPQGHPYSEENTIVRPGGWRYCRICRREKDRISKKSKYVPGGMTPEQKERRNARARALRAERREATRANV